MKNHIDFNHPKEQLVINAIFDGARGQARSFSDVFTFKEIDMMMSSDEVWEDWSRSSRDWIISAFDEMLSQSIEKNSV